MAAGGLCWQSRCPLVSLHIPAATSDARAQRQEGSCAGAILRELLEGGWEWLGTHQSHLSLEVPLSADTHHSPHTLGTSLRAALAPRAHSCASFSAETTAELPVPTPVSAGIPRAGGGPQEDSSGANRT